MKRKSSFFILVLFLASCCWKSPDLLKEVKDVTDLSQNHLSYLQDISKEKFILKQETQAAMNDHYDKIFFSVWHTLQPVLSSQEKLSLIFSNFSKSPGYGENKRKHSSSWSTKLQQNASLENYPNFMRYAITTRHTNLRALPTNSPHFYKPGGDSSGWPFDNLQISSVPANTPVLVCHLSADKSWALVETSFAFGWIPVEDSARVDENFIKTWESGRYAVVVKDKTAVFDAGGNFILRTLIGQVFPLVKDMADKMEILIAAADANNNAVIKRSVVSRQIIVPKPLPFTYLNAVKIANEFIDESYGWGGLYGNRDCSAMTRDFFAPFGVWLPRHSEDQAKQIGKYIDLQDLEPDQKEKFILAQGIPYLSLLWRRGHIMLFIGEDNGRALIFHNVWGLRTIDCDGQEGRKIIGKAVITTLHPGKELKNLDPEGLLIKNLSAITILAPGKQNQPLNQNDYHSMVIQEDDGI